MQNAIEAFTTYLNRERSLSDNTIRAYVGDLESLSSHLKALGVEDVNNLNISHLRSWLANQQSKGASRTTLSRRATSIKLFTKWAHFVNNLIEVARRDKVVRDAPLDC